MATEKELEKSFDDLVMAAAHFVELRGGRLLVSGDVHVIKNPGDLKYNWTLGIRCTGTPPQSESRPTPRAMDDGQAVAQSGQESLPVATNANR